MPCKSLLSKNCEGLWTNRILRDPSIEGRVFRGKFQAI